jgi:hypothetical protein
MAKYVLLYVGGGMPETEADTAAVMKAWEDWYTSLGGAVVDPGNPFSPAAKSIASDGKVSNSPLGAVATGYTILQADSLDSAASMAIGCPVLQSGASINVYETFDVM